MKVTLSTSGGTENLSGAVTVTATPVPSSQMTRVEFYVDDVLQSTDTSDPYSFSWDTATGEDGQHQLKARAFYPRNKRAETKLGVSTRNTVVPAIESPIQDVPVLVEEE